MAKPKKKSASVRRLHSDVKEKIAKGEVTHSFSGSSMDFELRTEIAEVEEIRTYLASYSGQHPILGPMAERCRRTPNWCPDTRDRAMYRAVMRRAERDRRSPLIVKLGEEVDYDGPTSLDP